MRTRLVKAFFVYILGLGLATQAGAATYVTEAGVQIDRCASAWFISRFVDARAEFVFFPTGNTPPKGVTYAFFGADYFRVGSGCTYTTLLRAHKRETEPALRVIDTIANDTLAWRLGTDSLAFLLRERVDQVSASIGTDAKTYEWVFPVLDLLYLKSGGATSPMQLEQRGEVDGVEGSLLKQWMSGLAEADRPKAAAEWQRMLAASGMSPEGWLKSVTCPGLQQGEMALLLAWAAQEEALFSPEVRSQILVSQKVWANARAATP